MGDLNKCVRFDGAILTVGPDSEFTDAEIERKRAQLARQWRVGVSQVTDYEAIAVMRQERAAGRPE